MTLKWKYLIILMVILGFFVFAYFSQFIRMDSTARVESILPGDDPYLVEYQEFEEAFGQNDYIIVAFASENIFSNEVFSFIKTLSNKLKVSLYGIISILAFPTIKRKR